MSRLEQLYQDMILEHNKHPRHFESIESPTHTAFGKNPLCGDEYHLSVEIKDNVVFLIGFQGSGCAISKSSASMMTELVLGKSVQEALQIKEAFLTLLMQDEAGTDRSLLGKLMVFEGVKKYPVRVKCATLIWRTLEAALEGVVEVSTE
ncbi:MAG: SUF system NifU family Fe-S cluster assembly protein [Candidatus Margulisbacteria bacterium]|nr:SUF system NifU family Fe-S cluster assembly protein [Candidatus Margulisiibacteriota bacterium]